MIFVTKDLMAQPSGVTFGWASLVNSPTERADMRKLAVPGPEDSYSDVRGLDKVLTSAAIGGTATFSAASIDALLGPRRGNKLKTVQLQFTVFPFGVEDNVQLDCGNCVLGDGTHNVTLVAGQSITGGGTPGNPFIVTGDDDIDCSSIDLSSGTLTLKIPLTVTETEAGGVAVGVRLAAVNVLSAWTYLR